MSAPPFESGPVLAYTARSALGYAAAPGAKVIARWLLLRGGLFLRKGDPVLSIDRRISCAVQSQEHTASATMALQTPPWLPSQAWVATCPVSHCSPLSSLPLLQQPGGLKRCMVMDTSSGSWLMTAVAQPSASTPEALEATTANIFSLPSLSSEIVLQNEAPPAQPVLSRVNCCVSPPWGILSTCPVVRHFAAAASKTESCTEVAVSSRPAGARITRPISTGGSAAQAPKISVVGASGIRPRSKRRRMVAV